MKKKRHKRGPGVQRINSVRSQREHPQEAKCSHPRGNKMPGRRPIAFQGKAFPAIARVRPGTRESHRRRFASFRAFAMLMMIPGACSAGMLGPCPIGGDAVAQVNAPSALNSMRDRCPAIAAGNAGSRGRCRVQNAASLGGSPGRCTLGPRVETRSPLPSRSCRPPGVGRLVSG